MESDSLYFKMSRILQYLKFLLPVRQKLIAQMVTPSPGSIVQEEIPHGVIINSAEIAKANSVKALTIARNNFQERIHQAILESAQDPLDKVIDENWGNNDLNNLENSKLFTEKELRLIKKYGTQSGSVYISDPLLGQGTLRKNTPGIRWDFSLYNDEDSQKRICPNTKEKTEVIITMWKAWDEKFLMPKDGNKTEALDRFEFEITDKYGINLGDTKNTTTGEIEAVLYCLKLLPEEALNELRYGLRGGIDTGFTGSLSDSVVGGIEGGGYDPSLGKMEFCPIKNGRIRYYIEKVLHELGHPLEEKHTKYGKEGYANKEFRELWHKASGDMHDLPAVGYPGYRRKDYMKDHFYEFFAENFMHYILHGESMSKGFSDIPELVKDNKLWKDIYDYYKKNVFYGYEYRVIDGEFVRDRRS